jgi:hypothetical protein
VGTGADAVEGEFGGTFFGQEEAEKEHKQNKDGHVPCNFQA